MGVVANTDGSVTVTFDLAESGGSGLSSAKIVAVREGSSAPADQKAVLDAATSGTAIVASSNLAASPGSRKVYNFSAGQLDYYAKYSFYIACQDVQGWYNSPPGSVTAVNSPGPVAGTKIGNNGERVYDPSPPTINVSDVRATTDGKLRVVYTLTESGNSMLNAARVAASTSAMTRDQVLAATTSAVNVVVLNTANVSAVNQVATIEGLSGWTDAKVYFAAKDNQGWYDNGSMTGSGNANSLAIGNNSARSWDTANPAISITTTTFTDAGNSNTIRIGVSVTDSGNSGINRAGVFFRESAGTNASVSQYEILFGTSAGVREALLSNTTSSFANSVTRDVTTLKEYTQYHVYAAVLDNQGNYNGSAATAHATTFNPVSNPLSVTGTAIPNGGRTYDLAKPVITISDAQAQSDGSVIVTYTLSESGGSGLISARIYVRTDQTALAASSVLVFSPNRSAVVGTSQTVTFAAADVPNHWTAYYFFAAAKDIQGWFNSSTSAWNDGTISAYAIQNNGGRTWDRTAPALNANPTMALASGTSVTITWSGASDSMSGLKHVKMMVTTSNAAFTNTSIDSAADSGNTQRVTTSTDASGTATISGIQTGATVYGWAVSVDKAGNVSTAQRTSPQSIALDNIAPTSAWVSGSQSGNTTATITVSVADNLTGITSGTVYVRRSGTSTNDYTGTISAGAGNKAFNVTGLQSFTNYDVVVAVTDGASNSSTTTVKTFKSWDTSAPVITTTTVTNTGTTANIAYNLSDSGSGLRSIACSGNATGSQSLSDTSANSSFTATGLSYGANSLTFTLTDRASDNNSSYLTNKADNTVTATGSITVTRPAPTFSAQSITGNSSGTNGTGRVAFTYTVVSDSGNLSKIEFYVGNALKSSTIISGSSSTGSYNFDTGLYNNPENNCYMKVYTNPDSGTATSTTTNVSISYSPPTISSFTLTSPSAEKLRYTWSAADTNSNLKKVEFYDSGNVRRTPDLDISGNSSSTYSEFTVAAGTYGGYIKVFDHGGLSVQSSTVSNVVVAASNVAPTISSFTLTSPSAGKLQYTWSAADTNSNLQKVEFYRNDAYQSGQDMTISGNSSSTSKDFTVAGATYSGYIKVFDANGLSVQSSTVSNVNVNVAPTISSFTLTSPSAGKLQYTWSAADTNSNLQKVEFYRNDAYQSGQDMTISGNSSSTSKEFTVAAGTYSGYIIVYDSGSPALSATSSAVSNVAVSKMLATLPGSIPAGVICYTNKTYLTAHSGKIIDILTDVLSPYNFTAIGNPNRYYMSMILANGQLRDDFISSLGFAGNTTARYFSVGRNDFVNSDYYPTINTTFIVSDLTFSVSNNVLNLRFKSTLTNAAATDRVKYYRLAFLSTTMGSVMGLFQEYLASTGTGTEISLLTPVNVTYISPGVFDSTDGNMRFFITP